MFNIANDFKQLNDKKYIWFSIAVIVYPFLLSSLILGHGVSLCLRLGLGILDCVKLNKIKHLK